VTYRIRFTRLAAKDVQKLSPKLQQKLKDVLRNHIAIEPHCGKPLVGELKGFYSMRLSYKDRIVYSIHDNELLVIVVRARTHYGD
jgi:addiction module RelE/StbE family toxin